MIKRLSIVFGIAVILGLLIWGLAVFLGNYGGQHVPPEEAGGKQFSGGQLPTDSSQEVITPVSPVEVQKVQLTPEETEKVLALNFAKQFAARLATYSNQNLSNNIDELLQDTTGQATSYLMKLKSEPVLGTEYVGTTSKAVSAAWIDWNQGSSGKVSVGLWRLETRESEERGFGQTIELGIQKQRDTWVVSEIQWKEIK